MSSFEKNIYYRPEKHGLELFGEVERQESYSFDKFVVWKRKDDIAPTWLYAEDSGCSCPSPYEDISGPVDLQASNSWAIVNAAMLAWLKDREGYIDEQEKSSLIGQIGELTMKMSQD